MAIKLDEARIRLLTIPAGNSMVLTAGKFSNLVAGSMNLYSNGIAISNPVTANDVGFIRVVGTGESDTVLEIATGDDGGNSTAEKIVARQYNTSNAIVREAVLLNTNGTTSFPVSVTSPSFIGALQGNAATASTFNSARTISLSGAVTGSVSSNGASGWSITTAIAEKAISPTNFTTTFRTQTKGDASYDRTYLSVIRNDNTDSWGYMPIYGSGIAFGHYDTHTYLYTNYSSAQAYIGGGSANSLHWIKRIAFTDGTGASGTWGISISGNAATASSVAWGNVTGKPGSRFVTYYNSSSEMSSTESVSAESYIHTVGASGGAVTTTTKPSGMDNAWGIIHLHLHSGNYAMQLGFGGTTGHMYQRHAYASSSFGAWKTILDSSNYTSYTVTKTGSGASGSWGISVTGSSASCTGNAATATVAATLGKSGGTTGPMKFYWSGQSGQPSWLWGGSDGTNMYVYNPSNFNVNSATKATQDANGYNISNNYEKRYQQIVDLTGSGYSTNTWYPVYIHIPYGGLHRVACVCQLDTGSVPSWSNHSAGFTRVLEMLVTASGWGTTGAYSICLEDYTNFTNDYCPVGYQQFTNSSSACFFCRGGGKYILQTDWFANWTIVTTSITVSSQTIAPVNSYPGVNFAKSRIYANITGDSLVGAVWNDYAEYRESDCKEFGRVLAEKGDDTLTKTTKRLQPFAGVSSDTWGFCQGETEKAKTPIAVAGRVLVYTYRNRKEYKPGDVVCAAPNGTVDIMTREEIIKYPDRIVGTVSCVPEYETWGSGDRDPVKVNGRIWIKVR